MHSRCGKLKGVELGNVTRQAEPTRLQAMGAAWLYEKKEIKYIKRVSFLKKEEG